jgi:Protein of unknown function (DUF4229)
VARQTATEPGARRAVLTYNLYRLGLLAVCLGIGWLLNLPGLVLIVSALFVSGVLSWFLLGRQRVAMGLAVERTVARGQARMAARAAAEDGYVDRMLADQESTAPAPEASSSMTQGPATTRGDQPAP